MFVRSILQFGLYLVVGGLSFLGDLAFFVLLIHMGMQVLWASAASFVVGSVLNYFLSTQIVFRAGRFERSMEVGSFIAVVLIGLSLTTVLMYILTGWVGLGGVAAKLITVPTVLVWNFLGRRLFVFHSDMPAEVVALSERLFLRLQRK